MREALKQRPDRGLDATLDHLAAVLGDTSDPNWTSVVEIEMKHDLDIDEAKWREMESLRLQMAMDRMSKMMSTLSNLLKKMSDTANQITQNMK